MNPGTDDRQPEPLSSNEQDSNDQDFERRAQQPEIGFFREFLEFLRHNKKWWLIPLLASLLLVSALALLGNSPLAPFIYSLF